MLTVIIACKALVEIALMLFIGRLVLAILAGAQRVNNPVYQLFVWLTAPVVRLARLLTPSFVLDRHMPAAAGAWLVCAWVVLTAAKIHLMRIAAALGGG